jgi:P22 coat protein - gene protein 5.
MINFSPKFTDKIQSSFVEESIVAGRLSTEYDFDGAKTVKVLTPVTIPMSDYDRAATTNRYGTPAEMQDIVQDLTLTQDKSFAMTIDKGNYEDQAFLKKAAKMLTLQVSERAIPEMDTYILKNLALKAGQVASNQTSCTRSNICGFISQATQSMDDAEVPQNDRTLFVSSVIYAMLKHSDEFLAVESVARDAIRRGVVGRYDNMEVVKVPAKRWPANVNFMIAHKNSAIAPVKLSETHIHTNPPGISGSLLEGRQYYDLFVFGAKCDGVYVNVDTSTGKGKVCAAPSINVATGAITCSTAGAIIVFTTDGTDPRYSADAKTGTQSDVTAPGTVIKAYAFLNETGAYPSGVTAINKT